MEIILIEKVERLGKLGDIVKVKRGYAKNFLLPQGKAIRASRENLEKFKSEKTEIEINNLKAKKDAVILGSSIEGTEITIIRSASETGQLYGSVSKRDIASSLNLLSHKVDHKQIILEKTIKELGLINISLRLHPEVDININLNIARSEEEAITQKNTGKSLVKKNEGDLLDDKNLPNNDLKNQDSDKNVAKEIIDDVSVNSKSDSLKVKNKN